MSKFFDKVQKMSYSPPIERFPETAKSTPPGEINDIGQHSFPASFRSSDLDVDGLVENAKKANTVVSELSGFRQKPSQGRNRFATPGQKGTEGSGLDEGAGVGEGGEEGWAGVRLCNLAAQSSLATKGSDHEGGYRVGIGIVGDCLLQVVQDRNPRLSSRRSRRRL